MSPSLIQRALAVALARAKAAGLLAACAGREYVRARDVACVDDQIEAYEFLRDSAETWSAAERRLAGLSAAAELVEKRSWERHCSCGGRFVRDRNCSVRFCDECRCPETPPCYTCGGLIGVSYTREIRTAAGPVYAVVCRSCWNAGAIHAV